MIINLQIYKQRYTDLSYNQINQVYITDTQANNQSN